MSETQEEMYDADEAYELWRENSYDMLCEQIDREIERAIMEEGYFRNRKEDAWRTVISYAQFKLDTLTKNSGGNKNGGKKDGD